MDTPDFAGALRAYQNTQALLQKYERTRNASLLPEIRKAKVESERAVDTWLSALQKAEEGNPMREPILFGLSMIYRMLGGAHMYLQEFDEATNCYESAVEIGDQIGQGSEVVQSLNNLGMIAMQRGRPAEAVDFIERAISKLDKKLDKEFGTVLRRNLQAAKAEAGW